MNALDYGLLGVLFLFLIYGFYRGFLRQAFILAGFGVAFFLAAKFHTNLAELDVLQAVRERSASVALVGSFLTIFFLTAALTSMIGSWIGKKMTSEELRSGNRILGGLLGLCVGTLLVGGACLGLKEWGYPDGAVIPKSQQGAPEPGLITESVLVPKLAEACLALVAFIPQEQREKITELYEKRTEGLRKSGDPGGVPAGGAMRWGDLLHTSFKDSGEEKGGEPGARTGLLDLGGWHKLTSKLAEGGKPVPSPAKPEEKAEQP